MTHKENRHKTAEKSHHGTQTRLHIKVSGTEVNNQYTGVNFALIASVIKGAIGITAEKHNLNYQAIEIILYIEACGGKAKLFRAGKVFHVKSIHHFYKVARILLTNGYIINEQSRSVGRFPANNYSLTSEGETIIREFNTLCIDRIKLFTHY